jgi:TIGR02646 family protein
MRYVAKNPEPTSFTAWKSLANEDWTPTYQDLRNPEKQGLHDSLLAEQGNTCCYCGRKIDPTNSHVEHFVPQGIAPEFALEYENLHASCIRDRSPKLPLHCGHAKDEALDQTLCISPPDPTCEQRFRYALDGAVLATDPDDIRANYMIELLKLETPSLRSRRQAALEGMFDNAFLESATDAELEQICAIYRKRDSAGQFEDFAHVIARFAEQLTQP